MPTTDAPTVSRNAGAVEVVHVPIPDGVELPPLPRQDDHAGHYQQVLLNTRTGQLSFFCADWRVRVPAPARGQDDTMWRSQHPGRYPSFSPGFATKPIPQVVSFLIDTWTAVDRTADEHLPTPAWVYMTREQGEAFTASLVPLAQRLVDELFRVTGTDDLEWSAEAVATARTITAACDRNHQGPPAESATKAGTVNFADAVTAVPELVKPEWAAMGDAALDETADTLNRVAYRWYPRLPELFGTPFRDGSGIGLDVYGARSWLYAYRDHEAGRRQVVDGVRWFATPEHTLAGRVTADHDDEALAAFADAERTAAAAAGITLVGIERVVRGYRAELRQRILEEDLPRAREAVERLQRAKAGRAGLLGQIIGWGDKCYHSDNDAELGRRAGMTRQAVNQLRTKLVDDDVD